MRRVWVGLVLVVFGFLVWKRYALLDDYRRHVRYPLYNLFVNTKTASVVFIGDSLTEFWPLEVNGFPIGTTVINRGTRGEQTAWIRARFMRDAVALKPQILYVLAGTNDVLGQLPVEIPMGNLRAMMQDARKAHIALVVGTLPPIEGPLGKAVEPLNDRIRTACIEEGCIVVDYYRALTDPKGRALPGIWTDGVHLTPVAYQKMHQAIMALL